MGLSTIEVAEARKATSDPVIIPVRVMLGIAFLKSLATSTAGKISISIDFHFYKRVEISGMIVVLLSM